MQKTRPKLSELKEEFDIRYLQDSCTVRVFYNCLAVLALMSIVIYYPLLEVDSLNRFVLMPEIVSSDKSISNDVIAIIFTQYLLSITAIVLSVVFVFINWDCTTALRSVVQAIVSISSNCCSIACTLNYINKHSEEKNFQSKRTGIIVMSLVVNISMTILFQSQMIHLSIDQALRIVVLMGLLTIALVYYLIRMQVKVELDNTDTLDNVSPQNQATIKESKEINKSVIVGDELYHFEEADNEG